MMENVEMISSSTKDENGPHEAYSEWRLLSPGTSWERGAASIGFQPRDFLTDEGAFPVIDPEILQKLRKEASSIENITNRCAGAIYFVLFFIFSSLFSGSYCLLFKFNIFALVACCYAAVLTSIAIGVYHVRPFLEKNADRKRTALVESYQSMFLEVYGVDIGYDTSIYLRRPRRLVDMTEPVLCGDSCDDMDGRTFFPPIYLLGLIPGEIDLDGNSEHDYALMKVDADVWSLLLRTHHNLLANFWSKRAQQSTTPFLWWWLLFFCFLIGLHLGLSHYRYVSGSLFLAFTAYLLLKSTIDEYYLDYKFLSVYVEVTKVVNEALQKDKKHSHLAVKFLASEVPGREGKLGRRYQFFQLAVPSTTK